MRHFISRWYGIVNVKNRRRRTVDRRQMIEVRGQRADLAIRIAEGGMIEHGVWRIGHGALVIGQISDDRGQMTKDGGQMAEDGGQMTEDR